jgi:RNA polymerase sigma-70 factor (ECF subfamily)
MRDAVAFDEFYRDTSARMTRYGFAMTGDLADAQDVVQEAYTRAWRHWRAVAAHPMPEAWVRLTVNRLVTDRWRKMRGWRAALIRNGPPEPVAPPGETSVLVTTALRRLPTHLRHAVVLHYLFDMSVTDIAAETGSPVGTVTSWLRRGRLELAAVLSPPESAPPEPTVPGKAAPGALPRTTLMEVNDVE